MAQLEHAPAALPDELRRFYASYGYQSDLTFGPLMLRNQRELGALPAAIEGDVELSWNELVDAAGRFGGFLQANGVEPGDVVTWQLPNWWESLIVAYGVWAAGAVSSPVVPIYREHELRQVVEAVQPKCVITAREFRGCDHVALMSDACRDVGWDPALRVVLRGEQSGWTTFEEAVKAKPFIADDVDPDAPAMVGWTSGTTSGAKGVVHSNRTYMSLPAHLTRSSAYGWDDRGYMPAPLAHATGLLIAIAIPAYTGASVVLCDHWDAELAVDEMQRHGVTFSGGATVFIQELLTVLKAKGIERFPMKSGYVCGGSTVPTAIAEAAEAVGLQACRSYGMTECPCVSGPDRFDPKEIRLGTDGRIAPGCEIRVVNDDGKDVGVGEVGEFVLRGPQRSLGYLKAEHTRDGFDDEGWFHSGDLGYVDADNAVTVTGRVKEIINRGGEKISGREIEDALIRHEAVVEAAVVPAPHERLGEQPAAFVLLRPGAAVSEEDLAGFLRSAGLAPQKIPRVWRYVDELPRTPSGKVKKYVLQAGLEPAGKEGP